MQWHDPARANEAAEDIALRQELMELLGASSSDFFDAEPTPELIALANDLRREALRRRHTSRHRPMRLLLAAGLPFALAVGGLGVWGLQQKHRADALAQSINQREAAFQMQLAEAKKASERQGDLQMANNSANQVSQKGASSNKPAELVILVKPVITNLPTDTQTVKGH